LFSNKNNVDYDMEEIFSLLLRDKKRIDIPKDNENLINDKHKRSDNLVDFVLIKDIGKRC